MGTLSWESIEELFPDLASGLAATNASVQGLLLGVSAAMVLFLVLFVVFTARQRGLRVRRGEEMYRYLVRRLGLSRSEQDLVARVSVLHHPAETRYLVLVDEEAFEESTARCEQRGALPEITLSVLRLKLDFGAGKPGEIPGSSAELLPGTPVIIVQKGRSTIRGRISEQEMDALVVELDSGAEPPTIGVPISVYFHNASGVFAFATYARQLVKSSIYLDHSETIRPTQRRRYYRKALKLPAYIMLRDRIEEPIRSSIVDLSGGGASLENPGMSVQPGDELALSFSPASERFTVPARVVRLSADGRLMHVQFQRLSESARDRLIGSLFRAQKRG